MVHRQQIRITILFTIFESSTRHISLAYGFNFRDAIGIAKIIPALKQRVQELSQFSGFIGSTQLVEVRDVYEYNRDFSLVFRNVSSPTLYPILHKVRKQTTKSVLGALHFLLDFP